MAWNEAEVAAAVHRSEELLLWNQSTVDGLTIPSLPHSKRTQCAGACLHCALEHSQAIVVLIAEGLCGSALALQRPLLEAWARGYWLMTAATDDDVERATNDNFPGFGQIAKAIDGQSQTPSLVALKDKHWSRLCSFTHTGLSQIGPRLTPTGLGHDYHQADVAAALTGADVMGLMTVGAFGALAGDLALIGRVAERVDKLEPAGETGRLASC